MTKQTFMLMVATIAALAGLALPAVQAQQDENVAVWSAQFYNNAILRDPVVHSRADLALGFNWGAGSPAAGVNPDNFSARWGTDVLLSPGTYRFFALADDRVRVVVDFQINPLIDTFDDPQPGQLVTGDIRLEGGVHHIQVDYSEALGDALLFIDWVNLADDPNPSGPNFITPPQPQPITIGGAWTAQYYANTNLSGLPTAILSEPSPTHNWGDASPLASLPADNFSARWTSQETLPAGQYALSVRADDGLRVTVDGVRQIDEFHGATGETYVATFSLAAGQHNFMVEYFEATGVAFIDFQLLRLDGAAGGTAANLWSAEYFSNPNLSGVAAFSQLEGSPTHQWGNGAPVVGLPPDNFSARWRSTQILQAGAVYTLTVQADDGVRVFVDGVAVIDEFHMATAETYRGQVVGTGGEQIFVVEYFEAQGDAFIDFDLSAPNQSPLAGTQSTGALATVNTDRLNVRSAPNTETTIVGRVELGETYPIVGRNTDSSWWQIDANGTLGWVFGALVEASNTANVPITDESASLRVPLTGFTVTSFEVVAVRSRPSPNAAILGSMSRGRVAQIGGRTADGLWWLVGFNDVFGWVSAEFVRPQAGLDLDRIPIMG